MFYAKEGYDVTAIEYVNHNLDILKSKITPNMKIRAEQGDAVDLSRFADNTFDITLVLGPLYHLFDKKVVIKSSSLLYYYLSHIFFVLIFVVLIH